MYETNSCREIMRYGGVRDRRRSVVRAPWSPWGGRRRVRETWKSGRTDDLIRFSRLYNSFTFVLPCTHAASARSRIVVDDTHAWR